MRAVAAAILCIFPLFAQVSDLANLTIHVYMTGLGPLDRPVPTGQPTPIPAPHPLRNITCSARFDSDFLALDTPYIAYAAGAIGIYQVDVTLPAALTESLAVLRCGDAERRTTGSFYTAP